MAHQSLYRAHRPKSFSEVAGQEHITSALAEQIKSKTVSHAYLFAGSRGLGKTSIARIFARELGTTERDFYEIDAASNNGVDSIRELSENVYTLPFESPYKVYILDEAHMLSKGAWNAFLKTLEEPPVHTIFILATTELSKVPETVQSRCQVYQFKKPTRAALSKVVDSVAKKEGYTLEAGTGDLVSLLADGSYRDALSILERVFSAVSGKKVERAQAEAALGAPRGEIVRRLVTALSEGKGDDALKAIREASSEEVDMNLYLTLVLDYMRLVLLIRHAPSLQKALTEEYGEGYAEAEVLAKDASSKMTHATLKSFLDATTRIRFSPVPSLPLELAVLELLGS